MTAGRGVCYKFWTSCLELRVATAKLRVFHKTNFRDIMKFCCVSTTAYEWMLDRQGKVPYENQHNANLEVCHLLEHCLAMLDQVP